MDFKKLFKKDCSTKAKYSMAVLASLLLTTGVAGFCLGLGTKDFFGFLIVISFLLSLVFRINDCLSVLKAESFLSLILKVLFWGIFIMVFFADIILLVRQGSGVENITGLSRLYGILGLGITILMSCLNIVTEAKS